MSNRNFGSSIFIYTYIELLLLIDKLIRSLTSVAIRHNQPCIYLLSIFSLLNSPYHREIRNLKASSCVWLLRQQNPTLILTNSWLKLLGIQAQQYNSIRVFKLPSFFFLIIDKKVQPSWSKRFYYSLPPSIIKITTTTRTNII